MLASINTARVPDPNPRSSLERSRRQDGPEDSPKTPNSDRKSTKAGHQRLVFCDPVALRYLEEDPATTLLERRRRLEGYEVYLVEQWACSRIHPTFIIATYTGDTSQSIQVGVLSVPTDESTWSTRLKVYFEAVSQFHSRRKETPYGTLMVTNLSGFPSALTVIHIPDGEARKHREDFIVNENLKRLGCSGRAGLNLQPPASSTRAKYLHLYRVSDKVPLYTSVPELVKLCQLALVIFDKLLPAYADGLLCDVTEKALNDWWSEIGTDFYNLEPNDGILGPTTVAALLGLVMGAHNRLKAAGAPVTKDPFEVNATKRAIAYFQKNQKLARTRRLDRQTLDKLHRVTAKAASGEGWGVPRALKSTVAELSGKGGEMVLNVVGARDKAAISEIETVDIERLSQLVVGARAKWLWQGKPIKSGAPELSRSNGEGDFVFSTDEQGGFMWTSKRRESVWSASRGRPGIPEVKEIRDGKDAKEINEHLLPSPDQRSGLDRFKDKVGIAGPRTHHHRSSKDPVLSDHEKNNLQKPARAYDDDPSPRVSPQIQRQETSTTMADERPPNWFAKNTPDLGASTEYADSKHTLSRNNTLDSSPNIVISTADGAQPSRSLSRGRQLAKSPAFNSDKYRKISPEFGVMEPSSRILRRSHSAIKLFKVEANTARAHRLPRHMSFSFVEDSVFRWEDVVTPIKPAADPKIDPVKQVHDYIVESRISQELIRRLLFLEQATLPWTLNNMELISTLEENAARHTQELGAFYEERLDDYLTLKSTTTDLVEQEKASLNEGIKRVDMLGAKLDYELNALESRIGDVEDGVADFEKNILDIESRIGELAAGVRSRSSWYSWLGWSSTPRRS